MHLASPLLQRTIAFCTFLCFRKQPGGCGWCLWWACRHCFACFLRFLRAGFGLHFGFGRALAQVQSSGEQLHARLHWDQTVPLSSLSWTNFQQASLAGEGGNTLWTFVIPEERLVEFGRRPSERMNHCRMPKDQLPSDLYQQGFLHWSFQKWGAGSMGQWEQPRNSNFELGNPVTSASQNNPRNPAPCLSTQQGSEPAKSLIFRSEGAHLNLTFHLKPGMSTVFSSQRCNWLCHIAIGKVGMSGFLGLRSTSVQLVPEYILAGPWGPVLHHPLRRKSQTGGLGVLNRVDDDLDLYTRLTRSGRCPSK